MYHAPTAALPTCATPPANAAPRAPNGPLSVAARARSTTAAIATIFRTKPWRPSAYNTDDPAVITATNADATATIAMTVAIGAKLEPYMTATIGPRSATS